MKMMGMGGMMGASPEMAWKMELHDLLEKSPQGLGEEKPTYTSEDAPTGGYIGSVTIHGQAYTGEEPGQSKKAAEQGAAKAATKALFPEEFKKLSSSTPAMPAWMTQGWQAPQKAKAPPSEDPKNKLNHGMQLLLGRSMLKGEMSFEVQTIEPSGEGKATQYQATMTLTPYEGGKSFVGEVSDSKSNAEKSAAAEAYKVLKPVFDPLETE